METTKYTVPEPMRWETVAFRMYGDVNKMTLLVEANPGVPAYAVIPIGTQIMVPILDEPDILADNLPPWKRDTQSEP